MSEVTVAAFDFDRTLTTRDSVVPFLRRVAGTSRLAGGTLRRIRDVAPAVARRDRDALRRVATMAGLRGVARSEIDRHAALLADHIVHHGLRTDTVARLGWHRDQGHRLVIVTASYGQYARIVGGRLGVDAVLATELDFDPADRCTGRLAGENCRAAEKVRRLSEWLGSNGWARDDVTVWAYGDSGGDRALLDFADHPIWVDGPLDSVAPTQ